MSMPQAPIQIQSVAYKEAGRTYRAGPHKRQNHQWYCVLYGSVEMIVDGAGFLLHPEQSILVPPGAERSPRSRGKAPGYMYAHFVNHDLHLRALHNRVVRTPSALRPDLLALAAELRETPGPDTEELVQALLVRILVGLCRSVRRTTRRAPHLNAGYQAELVRRVEAHMRRNLHRTLSREELAAAVCLSPAHLARVFRNVTEHTLVQRLTELRIAHAKQLLLESTLTITEISLEVGYASFSHFCKTFRRSVGVAPSDYRRSEGHVYRRAARA